MKELTSEPVGPAPPRDVDVLFLGSDPTLAEMYKQKLELDGYRVEVAPPSSDVVDQARTYHPDLIFLDLGRQAAGNLKIVEQLRSDGATGRIPVILLSGECEEDLEAEGIALGIYEYVVKTAPHQADSEPGTFAG